MLKIFATTSFAVLAAGAVLSANPTPADAAVVCKHVAGVPHVVCIEQTIGAAVGGVNPNRSCYYLPTAANGRVTGVHRVCS